MRTLKALMVASLLLLALPVKAQGQATPPKSANAATLSRTIGKEDLTPIDLAGTWAYRCPCLVFESDNAASTLDHNLAVRKMADYLGRTLTQAGLTAGALTLTFDAEGNCTVGAGGKTLEASYTLSGSTLTLTFPLLKKSAGMNVSQGGNGLQVGMRADSLLAFLQAIGGESAATERSLGSMGRMMNNYGGVLLGLVLTKQ